MQAMCLLQKWHTTLSAPERLMCGQMGPSQFWLAEKIHKGVNHVLLWPEARCCQQRTSLSGHPSLSTPGHLQILRETWAATAESHGTGRNCSRADEAGDKKAVAVCLSVFLLIEARAEAGISTAFYCWEKLSQGPAGSHSLKTGEKNKRKNKLKKEDMSKIKIIHSALWEILLSKPYF